MIFEPLTTWPRGPRWTRSGSVAWGLSLGGYRSFLLAALDPRIKVAVDVGWMTSFASQIRRHVIHTIGFTFHIAGLYRYLDLPDLAALIAPRALLVINGAKDSLFAPEGVRAAFEKIGACFHKAGACRPPALPDCTTHPTSSIVRCRTKHMRG